MSGEQRCPTCKCDPVYLCHHPCDDPWHDTNEPISEAEDRREFEAWWLEVKDLLFTTEAAGQLAWLARAHRERER